MAIKHTLPLCVALACCLTGCHSSLTPSTVAADAASCIPAGTVALAGIDLDRLRAAPLYSKLPAAAVAIVGSSSTASSALLAYDGKELLVAARGRFAQAPPGATLAAPNLALFGSPQLVAAAMAQYRSHATGAPALVALAEPIAAGQGLWIVTQGGVPLPLTGNAANWSHLMQNAESVTAAAKFDSGLALAITALGRTANSARTIEETLRADVTLAAAAEARQPSLAKLLRSVRIDRDDRTVRIAVTADADAAAQLLAALTR